MLRQLPACTDRTRSGLRQSLPQQPPSFRGREESRPRVHAHVRGGAAHAVCQRVRSSHGSTSGFVVWERFLTRSLTSTSTRLRRSKVRESYSSSIKPERSPPKWLTSIGDLTSCPATITTRTSGL